MKPFFNQLVFYLLIAAGICGFPVFLRGEGDAVPSTDGENRGMAVMPTSPDSAPLPDSDAYTKTANRWVIIIDAVKPADGLESETAGSFEQFRKELQEAGIPENHILFYSVSDTESESQPTRGNLLRLFESIRNLVIPVGSGKTSSIRAEEGICEVQCYITIGGVSDADGTKNMLVPSDVDTGQLKSVDDERLISLTDLEDAMIHPADKTQTPIERTLLVVNFISLTAVTRGSASDFQLREIRSNKVPEVRVEDRFQHLRILVENEQITDQTATGFYQMLQKGLRGFADISGDRDGVVQARELILYLNACQKGNTAFNGNDPFPIGKARQSEIIPDGLFKKIGDEYKTEFFPREKEEAFRRDRERRNHQKGMTR